MRPSAKGVFIAVVFAYHLLYSLGFYEQVGIFLNPLRTRAISLGLVLSATFLFYSAAKKSWLLTLYRVVAILAVACSSLYVVFGYDIFAFRIGSAVGYEVLLGVLAIVFVLEATRITSGGVVVLIAVGFLLYAMFGRYLPGFFKAPPASITLVSGQTYLGLMGIYGVTTEIIVDYVFGFLVFGYALQAVGGMRFFAEVSSRIFGGTRGAGAKVAITSNLLFGMVQGSTLAAVLITGPLTIPQMRKEGYSERYMGGLIAAAADAAQLMPPVMGVVAFVMAEYLNVPYVKVCAAALLPGFLYYLSLFVSSHMEAIRDGLNPLPVSLDGERTTLWRLLATYWHCLGAFFLLIFLLGTQATTIRLTVMAATGFLLIAGSFRKDTRPTWKSLVDIVPETVRGLVAVAPVCATAGVIIASIGMSSLDYKLSAELTDLAGQSVFLLLIISTIACFVLGMGLPTLPAYIVVVLLVTPTLLALGLQPIVVHMFVFYMALAAMLTPPVCLNVYAVVPMVSAGVWETGLTAVLIGAARYAIPFIFVYRPGLLLIGSTQDIVRDVTASVVTVIAICFAQSRFGLTRATWPELLLALVGAFLICYPGGMGSLVGGAALLALTLASQSARFLRIRPVKGLKPG